MLIHNVSPIDGETAASKKTTSHLTRATTHPNKVGVRHHISPPPPPGAGHSSPGSPPPPPAAGHGLRTGIDPFYLNLPNYDVPVHAFKRKQSYPGDILISDLRPLHSQESQEIYSNMPELTNAVSNACYDNPGAAQELYLDMSKTASYARASSRATASNADVTQQQEVYANYDTVPKVKRQTDEVAGVTTPQQEVYANYDTIPNIHRPHVGSSKNAAGDVTHQELYDTVPSTHRPVHPPHTHQALTTRNTTPKQKRTSTNQNRRTGHATANQNRTSQQTSHEHVVLGENRQSDIYQNAQQLQRMSRKESYPGDIELPAVYTMRKRSVPFVDDQQEMYMNQGDVVY